MTAPDASVRLLRAIRDGHGTLPGSELAKHIGMAPGPFWDLVARGCREGWLAINDKNRLDIRFEAKGTGPADLHSF